MTTGYSSYKLLSSTPAAWNWVSPSGAADGGGNVAADVGNGEVVGEVVGEEVGEAAGADGGGDEGASPQMTTRVAVIADASIPSVAERLAGSRAAVCACTA